MTNGETVALDIGGANLKAAHADGTIASVPFALWKHPGDLPGALDRLLATLPAADCLAVTMTGELCDCFVTKAKGVHAILDAVEQIADGRTVRVFQTDGRFVPVDAARETPLETAAANWMALAIYAAGLCGRDPALLIDIGSTTTDIIPLYDGQPHPRGRTDTERLVSGELVYTGVRRTPVCALVQSLPWRGGPCRVAAELFATTLDVYLHTGDIPEDEADTDTADGRPATRKYARGRLVRMICADETMLPSDDTDALVEAAANAQHTLITAAISQVVDGMPARPKKVVISGSGEFLARSIAQQWLETDRITSAVEPPSTISLSSRHGTDASSSACAFALVQFAAHVR